MNVYDTANKLAQEIKASTEYEKYKNAAVYTCGNYVIYTIMTPEDSASLLSGIRAILTD